MKEIRTTPCEAQPFQVVKGKWKQCPAKLRRYMMNANIEDTCLNKGKIYYANHKLTHDQMKQKWPG